MRPGERGAWLVICAMGKWGYPQAQPRWGYDGHGHGHRGVATWLLARWIGGPHGERGDARCAAYTSFQSVSGGASMIDLPTWLAISSSRGDSSCPTAVDTSL